MRNYLLLVLSILAMSSCATKKYGCGLSHTTTTQLKPTLVSGSSENQRKIKLKYIPSTVHTYRGYGEVSVIDTCIHPYSYLIRTGGYVIKNDNIPTQVKYVIAYESNFTDQLKPNIGKVVFFECKSVHNVFVPAEMLEIVDGCVEQVVHNFVRKDGTIVFHKM